MSARAVRSIMTSRGEVAWLDLDKSPYELRREMLAAGHSIYPLARGTADELAGVAAAKDPSQIRRRLVGVISGEE